MSQRGTQGARRRRRHRALHRAVRALGGALLLGLCAGCPHPRAAVPQMESRDKQLDDGKLSVSLRTMLVTPSGDRAVEESETLHSGDRVYFVIRTSQPAYLYVILFGPDGSTSVLYPPSGGAAAASPDQAIAARCPLRLPAQGSFFLKSPAGPEDVRVVASQKPLAIVDRRLCEQLRLPCQPVAIASPLAPAPCPPEDSRAIFSSVRVATASPSGVASLRLTLKHDP